MKALWKLSGKFAGWVSSSGRLYNYDGDNVGYMLEDVVYSLEGVYLGEIYKRNMLAKRIDPLHPSKSRQKSLTRIFATPLQDRTRHRTPFGWADPEI